MIGRQKSSLTLPIQASRTDMSLQTTLWKPALMKECYQTYALNARKQNVLPLIE